MNDDTMQHGREHTMHRKPKPDAPDLPTDLVPLPVPNEDGSRDFLAQVVRVVDGDTIVFRVLLMNHQDLGFHVYHTLTTVQSFRLRGAGSPEVNKGSPENRKRGLEAKWFTEDWCRGPFTDPWPFFVRTYKDVQTFGRFVAVIIRRDTGESLADVLVAAGHATWGEKEG